MSLEDDAITLAATWVNATATFTGVVVEATSDTVDIPTDFAIVDLSESGVSFESDGAGSWAGTLDVEVSVIYTATTAQLARKYCSDLRSELLAGSDSRLLTLSTSQIAILEPDDSPYAGRWTCQFTLTFYVKP